MTIRCLLLLCLSILPIAGALPARADVSVPWDAGGQGRFITCLCRDLSGHIWVGTEDGQGLWSYDPAAKAWAHFPSSPDLSGDIYAVACDKAGRIWAGGLSGVSVYNGKTWRQYGITDGPLGTRLFALAVSPKDGSVWGATEAGLFRYINSRWTYFSRADGLPSDQAQALAFAPDGTLYIGTQCDGVAVGSPTNNYKTWRVTPGSKRMPNAAIGSGLPSGLINALLVAHDGTVYAGTTCGLAHSVDGGDTWHYVRGVDWKDKLAGLYRPIAPASAAPSGNLLAEDYVSCLAEDAQGRIFLGHRQKGVEAFSPKTGLRVQSGANGATVSDYVSAVLATGQSIWLGRYGGGLLTPDAAPDKTSVASSALLPPLPSPAAPPTLAELNTMLARVKSLHGEMPVGGGAFLGEDWRTLGDWVGHYGRQYAVLCAVASPMDQVLTWDSHYAVDGQLGPHVQDKDLLRHFISATDTKNLKTLYSPVDGFRTQAEWDDHGETYPTTFEGPDVWVAVTVPEGVHRVSLYDVNKDGHDGDNANRDYLVDLLPYRPAIADALTLPPLAHARIHNFWNGLYTSFVVRGPSQYYIRVAKSGSKNAVLPGVFIDKLTGPTTHFDKLPMAFMSVVHFDPPNPDASQPSVPKSDALAAARSLWTALDTARSSSSSVQLPYRVLALRAALATKAPDDLIKNWKWNLNLWSEDDRLWFDRNMELAQKMHTQYPNMMVY